MGNCCPFHTPPSPSPPLPPAPSQPPPSQSSTPLKTLVTTFDEDRLQELGMVMNLRETLLGFIKHGRVLVDEVVSCVAEEGDGKGKGKEKEEEETGTTTNRSSTGTTTTTTTGTTATTTTTLLAATNNTAKAAHALKGAAKTVGALRLATCAEAVERQAKQGVPCADLLPALLEAFDDLATAISRRSTW